MAANSSAYSTLESGMDVNQAALRFFRWLHDSQRPRALSNSKKEELLQGVTRDKVGELYRAFVAQDSEFLSNKNKKGNKNKNSNPKNLEGKVMAALRIQKLMRSKRYEGEVICVFALGDGRAFAPLEERQNARQKLRAARVELRSNKSGIEIGDEPILIIGSDSDNDNRSCVVPMNETITLQYHVVYGDDYNSDEGNLTLEGIQITGSNRHSFSVLTRMPMAFSRSEYGSAFVVELVFRTTRTAAHRATVVFRFVRAAKAIRILRDVLLRSGDAELYDVLEAKSPYTKRKKHKENNSAPLDPKNIVMPPKEPRRRGGGYKGLAPFRIPKSTRSRIASGEMEDLLVSPWDWETDDDNDNDHETDDGFGTTYAKFWQNLLWSSELQAYDDISLFDLDNVALQSRGKLLGLRVSGLAEGRPSVLKGDLVHCRWKEKEYRGRVMRIEDLHVLLEFDSGFHRNFDPRVDRLDRVRFTFQRTTFRTAHAGILAAQKSMGRSMLLPSKADVERFCNGSYASTIRSCPPRWKWASPLLNEEQQEAVKEICRGMLRPLPYVIFGPPGTGKTTTLVEAIYQLANLKTKTKMNILVVAPSNDATDILVEKLSQYFPPSEMVRVLAYTRSIDQVPEPVRKYCTDGMEAEEVISKIRGVRITVATINMASRLWCTGGGLPKTHFDVLCVDEAGHSTEPEVVAAAATIMNYHHNKGNGCQLVLAGDPMQLGPIVTSELCKKFRMDRSYMERLVHTSPAYRLEDNSNRYPPELVTLLVNNYRSHPDILKLPNEMFYRDQLVPMGDVFTTHSMARWEHLPRKGFPMLFHAVDGENTREGTSPSWFNPQEAMVVVEYVRKLAEESKPKIAPEDIGVITPYARQVEKIRLALRVSGLEGVKVGSVETFQGQERRVIIISTVRSENSLLQHDLRYNLGFVANEKRFNVAVTRAKALLIVVGNPRVLETDTKNWLPLLRFCKSHGSWLGEDWNEGDHSSSDSDADADSEDEDGFVHSFDNLKLDKDEWAPAAQESYCFINREE